MGVIANQKLNKKTTETIRETINFTDLLDGNTIDTINSITASTDLTITNEAINVVPIVLDGQTIDIGMAVQFDVAGGVNLTEYVITINIETSGGDTLEVDVILFVTNNLVDYYGSVAGANEYFTLRLNVDDWNDAPTNEKLAALMQATRAIDRLNFAGEKLTTTQLLQFPRDDDENVPQDIMLACYEEALVLLAGNDPQEQISSMRLISQGISSAKETYDRSTTPENVTSGILSHVAWAYIRPYLQDPREIILSRV